MLIAERFRTAIIAPTLASIGLDSTAAQMLLLATAIQESKLTARRQLRGPALGLYQMEPDTHDDIWENYLQYRPLLAGKVLTLVPTNGNVATSLERNDRYATAMARLQYARASEPLPHPTDVPGMARYWKRHYNTPKGLGTVAQFIQSWNASY